MKDSVLDKQGIRYGFILALLIAILTGCSQSSEGQWNVPGVGGSGYLKGRVSPPGQSKQQSKTLYAKAGQNIIVKYAVTHQAGNLSIAVYNTKLTLIADRLWSARLGASATNEVQVPIQKSGNHEILINLSGFAGTYDVSWKNQ
ncbi:MAG: hypothetical protein HZA91_00045 [Verrucomicrobia bacterium]|nr:hypothetical protein [Verrucomicrobiota bacterium]